MSGQVGAASGATLKDRLFALAQRALPTRWLSQQALWLARVEQPAIKNTLIQAFVRGFDVRLDEAAIRRPEDYPHFNAFFTRALREGARPVDRAALLVSPADGSISELGRIQDDRLLQAKGHRYLLTELLGGFGDLAALFRGGSFATIYLAPRDYHRLHMPITGRLRETVHVPGRRFSVNAATARAMPRLFARNERVIAIFDTAAGPLALVLVGALFVGSIETVWGGLITPRDLRAGVGRVASAEAVTLEQGAEFARFNMGSTVILLAAPETLSWRPGLAPGALLKVGRALADAPRAG